MKTIFGFFFSVVVLSSAAVRAEVLSWDSCLQQATRDNAELGAAQSNLSAAESQAKAAYAGFLPQISGSVNYNYGTTNNSSSNSNPAESYSASLTGTENLFSGFQDKAKVEQAKANRGVARANLATAKAQLSYDLKSAFSNLLYSQKAVRLTEEIIQRRESNLRLVNLRFESGNENKGSYLLSKANLEQAKLDNLLAKDSLEVASANLARVLGREDYDSISVSGQAPTTDVPDRQNPQGLNFHQLALETPNYQQVVAQEEAATAGLTLVQANFFPTLNVTGTTTNSGTEWYPPSNRWTVGAGLTFPLFSGGKDYYTSQAASETLRAAVHNRVSGLKQVLTKLKQAYTTFAEAVQKLEVDRTFQEASLVREKIGKQKYNNGLLSFEEWDIIENDLISRQKSFLQSERDRVISEAAWEQAQGRGVIP